MMWPFGKRKTPFEAAGMTQVDAVGFRREIEGGEEGDHGRTRLERLGEIPEEKSQRERPVATERETGQDGEPLGEGEGMFGIRMFYRDEEKFKGDDSNTPEFIFGRMDALNPYHILSWIPVRDLSHEASLQGPHSETQVPAMYTFRGVSYRLRAVTAGGIGAIYHGTAVFENRGDRHKYRDRPQTIIFKSIPRGAKDPHTLQEIALLAALHPDPKAPKDSIAHAVLWAGREAEDPKEVRGRVIEGTRSPSDALLEMKEGQEAFPAFYEAVGYRIGKFEGFGIVMEYLGPATYEERMNTLVPFPKDKTDQEKVMEHVDTSIEALSELTLAAEAMAELHARGIVHRDVKPANMFLRQGGHVVLADVGIGYHPYYRGREHLPEYFKQEYDTMLAYGAALYGLLQERGIGFGIIDPEAKERAPEKVKVRQKGKHLSQEDELALWETMRLIASAVYTAEVSDQERLALLQQAFSSAKGDYGRLLARYDLPKVQPLSRTEQREFLREKLVSKEGAEMFTGSRSGAGLKSRTEFKKVEEFESAHIGARVDAIGTPQYMAPEQARGIGLSTQERRKMDLFALGIVAMERLKLGTVPRREVTPVRKGDPNPEEALKAYRKAVKEANQEILEARASGETQGVQWEPDNEEDEILMRLRDFLRDELMAKKPSERPEAWEAARAFQEFAGEYRNVARRLHEKQAKQTAYKEAERAAG